MNNYSTNAQKISAWCGANPRSRLTESIILDVLGFWTLLYADLRGADLRSADLRGAGLQDANLRGAPSSPVSDGASSCPEGAPGAWARSRRLSPVRGWNPGAGRNFLA